MADHPLPQRPDLSQLKRQAKDLLRSSRSRDPAALSRFRVLPAFQQMTNDELTREELALHDAQSVIAREHGFPSWRTLRETVEEAAYGPDDAAERFVEAATGGRRDRAERLLAQHPELKMDLYAALVTGDAATLEKRLQSDPDLARRAGGVRSWEPLHYICHTALARSSAGDSEGLVASARMLLEKGADPDTRFPWLHHGVRRPVLWGATCVTRLLPLAEVLLDAGANPNDGVTLPLSAGFGEVPTLELLLAHGADVDQPWATDGSATIYAILQWSANRTGVEWLLAHGADPDPVFADNGETPLHVVAQRWDAALAAKLVERGADVVRPRADGRTPYALAALTGNAEVATWLRAYGVSDELSGVDSLIAAASRGERSVVDEALRRLPELRNEVQGEHYVALHRAAEEGNVQVLKCLLACGLDPDHQEDGIGKTALHGAAMEGRAEAVRTLLEHGASPAITDREFNGQPLVWAAEGCRIHPERGDYALIARLLIDAGSPLDWEAGDEPAEGLLDLLEMWRRRRFDWTP